jgi:hypothetical protein
MSCAECEAMLTDFIDGTLSDKDHAAFDLHIATCKECSQMLVDAQRGGALLEMLKSPRPEPASSLLDRIIAQTSGTTANTGASPATVLGQHAVESTPASTLGIVPAPSAETTPLAAGTVSNVIPFRPRPANRFNLQAIGRTLMQPRLAMTAAMAFFSIALTMNLTGIHLNELKASDLRPSSLKHSFYQADASLVRYYENLRVVYELESRLNELKQSNESDGSGTSPKQGGDASPEATPDSSKDGSKSDQQRKQSPKAGSGTSQRSNPQPVFKLVMNPVLDPSGRTSSHAPGLFAANWAVCGKENNKSKEVLLEGGLV